jgi:hypothetical protein
MSQVQVALVNASRLSDADVAGGLDALQEQVHDDFGPVWHVDAELQLVSSEQVRATREHALAHGEHPPDCGRPASWALVLLDEEAARGPLRGHHDMTYHGLPVGRVLVDHLAPGQDWTHAASHELLELLVDPDCNAVAYRHPDSATVLFYAREICDPVAAYTNGYERRGRWVSDFVFPTWFSPTASGRGADRFDERGLVTEPFEVLSGGYIGVFDPAIAAWVLQGADDTSDEVTLVGSRMERRCIAGNRWLRSDLSTSP